MNKIYDQILTDWKSQKYAPIYFLHGDEEFYIKKIIDKAESTILSEAEKAFNQIVLYGKETQYKSVLDHVYQFPMMAPYRLVILKEAQSMRDFDMLQSYFEKPADQTIFIVSYTHKKLDKRKKIWKSISSNAIILESNKIYENKVPAFIKSYIKEKGHTMDPVAMTLMTSYLGTNLSKISNELDKLMINLNEKSKISTEHIQKYIGISKDYNIFEFNNALGSRNGKAAFSIAQYFSENSKNNPIQMILPSLENHFMKILIAKQNSGSNERELASKLGVHPFFIKDYKSAATKFSPEELLKIFRTIEDYDKKSKGVGSRNLSQGEILQELVYKILN